MRGVMRPAAFKPTARQRSLSPPSHPYMPWGLRLLLVATVISKLRVGSVISRRAVTRLLNAARSLSTTGTDGDHGKQIDLTPCERREQYTSKLEIDLETSEQEYEILTEGENDVCVADDKMICDATKPQTPSASLTPLKLDAPAPLPSDTYHYKVPAETLRLWKRRLSKRQIGESVIPLPHDALTPTPQGCDYDTLPHPPQWVDIQPQAREEELSSKLAEPPVGTGRLVEDAGAAHMQYTMSLRVTEYSWEQATSDLQLLGNHTELLYLQVLLQDRSQSGGTMKGQPLLLEAMAGILEEMVAMGNARLLKQCQRAGLGHVGQNGPPEEFQSVFHGMSVPNVSLQGYYVHLLQYGRFGASTLLLAFIYMMKLIKAQEHLLLDSWCVHRIILSSSVVAAKFLEDRCCTNQYYAKVGGISGKELNALEVELICLLSFDLFSSPETLELYAERLYRRLPQATRNRFPVNGLFTAIEQ